MIILDRDGVINIDSEGFIKTEHEWRPLPGSLEAIVRLQLKGIPIAVATNQSGISRGLLTEEDLHGMHAKMNRLLITQGGKAIEHIYYCPHDPSEICLCRKPLPGMVQNILRDLQKRPEEAIMVGDSLRDIQAAQSCGVRAVLVQTGKGRWTEAQYAEDLRDVPIYKDLGAVVESLICAI